MGLVYNNWNICIGTNGDILCYLTLVDTGINITFLYQTFGWSTKLFAGIFNSITHNLILQSHKNNYVKKREVDDEESLEIKNFQHHNNKNNIYPKLSYEMV